MLCVRKNKELINFANTCKIISKHNQYAMINKYVKEHEIKL